MKYSTASKTVLVSVAVIAVLLGGLYAFIVSFVDVPVAMFLAASDRTTYPVELFYAMEQDFNPSSLASASLTALLALVLVAAAQKLVGLDNFLKAKSK